MTKWYWWVILGLAVVLTALVVIASWRNKSKKVEGKIVTSDPDMLATAASETYKTLDRVAEQVVNPSLGQPTVVVGEPIVARRVSELANN